MKNRKEVNIIDDWLAKHGDPKIAEQIEKKMEEINSKYEKHYGLTVGELLDFINKHNLPRESKVLVERVEDYYFTHRGWTTKDKVQDDEEHKYIDSWCAVKYEDDNLYIDCHY